MRSKFVAICDIYGLKYKATKFHVWGRLVRLNLVYIHSYNRRSKSRLEFYEEVSYNYSTLLLGKCLVSIFSR